MTIRVLSFDFDGCLFHEGYVYDEDKNVIKTNRKFLEEIKAENHKYSKNIALVGSNRQDKNTDDANAYNFRAPKYSKGSCFPAFLKIVEFLGVIKDTFLLADLYGDLKNGTSFTRAINQTETNHASWIFDETKASLIYAQIHKIAVENPNDYIVFDFFDDRGNKHRSYEDILEWLNKFYESNRDMIPKNVKLRLNHYARGDAITPLFEIDGTGIIDSTYRETVKAMADKVAPDYKGIRYFATDENLAIHLDEIKKARVPADLVTSDEVANDVEDVETETDVIPLVNVEANRLGSQAPAAILFNTQIGTIKIKIDKDFTEGSSAHKVATSLHNELQEAYQSYFISKTINTKDFEFKCNKAIKDARPELETHRGWKEVFINVMAALSMLVVGYLIGAAIKQNICLFKIKTDSAEKLDALQNTVKSIASA
ncbi:hypothetical protein [Legionella hackeliae]|uniref:Dot/Icm T4SS effector n=1 Tax=Legionella hackeliae TaxID=449 RepID=A0A0A8UTF2_LEGHA|nr:hypothetical protein [Legionella hackeliae]KTD09863.1 Dot/Icm T4SS effector [Legionella hackeliae]CEK10806.1 conserved protein of unknown function [Legionella hackeliae]STX47543.1 Dot/Icm secretion system substrate [Legionella hackeliae]